MKNLILEGFMGCGKTSVSKALSERLRIPLYDTDLRIEEKNGLSISEIFERSGEEAFRDMETAELEELTRSRERMIISLGGGMPVREENRRLLKKLGTVFYLKAPFDLLYERLSKKEEGENRPMLKDHELMGRIKSLLKEREEAYLAAADFTLAVSGDMSVEDVVFAVRKAGGYEDTCDQRTQS